MCASSYQFRSDWRAHCQRPCWHCPMPAQRTPNARPSARGRASGLQAQTLQPTPPRAHAAVPNHCRTLGDLARALQCRSVQRAGRPLHPKARPETLWDRPQLRAANQLCPQLIERFANIRHLCPRLCHSLVRRLWTRLLRLLLLQRAGRSTHAQPRPSLPSRCRPSAQRTICGQC